MLLVAGLPVSAAPANRVATRRMLITASFGKAAPFLMAFKRLDGRRRGEASMELAARPAARLGGAQANAAEVRAGS